MKSFNQLIANIKTARIEGDPNIQIKGICFDSRKVQPGDLFIAWKGEKSDGHDFINSAIANGAAAVLCEKELTNCSVPWVSVDKVRDVLWKLSAEFYDNPTSKLKLIGITGTNGKTSTALFIRKILEKMGHKTAFVGTLGVFIGDRQIPGDHTTPEAPELQQIFAEAVNEGCTAAVMEVSSHGLALKRVYGCQFDTAVFTNLTQDHLDFHTDMEDYYQAKLQLFTEAVKHKSESFSAIINIDDSYGERIAKESKGKIFTYGEFEKADIRALDSTANVDSVHFMMNYQGESTAITVGVGGRFNVYNGLAAAVTGIALGADVELIRKALSECNGVDGRFQSVTTGKDFNVIVDYAHTPDALEKLLITARELKPTRLTAVFGCGGDRDPIKRPIMGNIAAEISDKVFVTSDNPRTENPDKIIEQIVEGIPEFHGNKVEVEPDRKLAIKKALQTAISGELIVIAGKGHEDYQIIGKTKYPFDDRLITRELLGELK